MSQWQSEEKPQLGDLIEIFRGKYEHWGIYVGDGCIIHLVPPSEQAQAGAYSMMSVLCDKAMVKKEELWVVAGDDKYTVNNLLDKKYEPRSVKVILQEARGYLGAELPYCVFSGNCEHFVTELRYGKAESRQVRKVAEMGAAVGIATIAVGVLATVVSAFFRSGNKEEENKDTQ